MAATETEICNLALTRIGQGTITSLDEAFAPARACKTVYDPAREKALRHHPWNFASKTALLAQVGTTPEAWTYAYQLPVDLLRAVKIIPGANSLSGVASGVTLDRTQDILFEIQGDLLLTNESEVVLLYVWDITDTNKFDAAFVSALAFLIASEVAMSITQKPALQQGMYQSFLAEIPPARAVDSSEGRREQPYGTTIVDSRL